MKIKKIAPRILTTFIVLSLVFTSCTKDENDSADTQQQNLEELRMSSEMDDMETVLEDVVITAYEDQETAENRMANAVLKCSEAIFCSFSLNAIVFLSTCSIFAYSSALTSI